MKSTVLEMVIKLAKQVAADRELNELHLLLGYARLLCIGETMLDNLFPAREDKEELKEVRSLLDARQLDIDMMKKGLGLLISCDVKDEVLHEAKEAPLEELSAKECLSLLLEHNQSITDTFQTGCTLEDVIRLKNALSKEPANTHQEEGKAQSAGKQEEGEEGAKDASFRGAAPAEAPEIAPQEAGIESLALRARDLYYNLREHVIGQDDAVDLFIRGYFKSEMFAGVPGRPRAVFLFAGPPGVGKTLLATEAARVLERPCMRLNMSEYADHQSATELIGVSKKYAQASKGKLTSYVEANPNAVLIFDEVEKAHLNVVHLFLQILDGGVLQDSYEERNISFKDTLLIFTTNAGKALYEENAEKNLSHLDPSVVLDALEKEPHPVRMGPLFPAAICSRFTAGNVVMFNHLQARHLQRIVQMNFDTCKEKLEKRYHWQVTYDHRLPELFLFHQSAKLDARIVSSKSIQFIQDEVYEYARQAIEKVNLENIETIDFQLNYDGTGEDVQRLFRREGKTCVALLGDLSAPQPSQEAYEIVCMQQEDALRQVLSEQESAFAVIDPDFGMHDHQADYGFSLDDIASSGMRAFHRLRKQSPDLPIYLLDRDQRLRDTDKITFTKQGASGFVACSSADPKVLLDALAAIASDHYIQEQLRELANKGKHLSYNTAQKISADQKTAIIEFYDFKLYTAYDAADQSVVLGNADRPKVTFADIIGAKNAKEELKYFVEFLKNPRRYVLNGVLPPKGILLYGPPGTGKTMLARAMAGEADATFFATNATDFMDKYLGEGEEKIRSIFKAARKYAPSIIFIDEIDAIAKERTGESHVETYLNTLMTEMDGFQFDVKKPVFVLAATNFAVERGKAGGRSMIDPALLRRFDNKIEVDLPTKDEREEYIRLCFQKSNIHGVSSGTIKNISDRTMGESLANIQNVIHLAIRNAGKADTEVTDELLLNAMEEYYYGEQHTWNQEYYEHVARHEAGHAYVTFLSGKTPSFVTIVSRGNFGGYMQHASDEEVPTYTKEDLLWRIRIALAGRASELVFYGKESGINTGVSGDLQTATRLALNMVSQYGMDENTLLSLDINKVLSSDYGRQVMERAEAILQEELKKTMALVQEGKEKIRQLSEKLMDKNQLVESEIRAILEASA